MLGDLDDIELDVLKSACVLAFSYVGEMKNLSLLTNIPSESTPEIQPDQAPLLCHRCARQTPAKDTPSSRQNKAVSNVTPNRECVVPEGGHVTHKEEDASAQEGAGGDDSMDVTMNGAQEGGTHVQQAQPAGDADQKSDGVLGDTPEFDEQDKRQSGEEEEEEEEEGGTWGLLGFGNASVTLDKDMGDDKDDEACEKCEEYLCDDGIVKIGYANLVVELLRPSQEEIGLCVCDICICMCVCMSCCSQARKR